MIKTKALNEFKGDISLSFGLMGDNRHLNKMFNNPTQNPACFYQFYCSYIRLGGKESTNQSTKGCTTN